MRRTGSPYRKAEAAAGLPSSFRRLTGFPPRRSRVILYALLAVIAFLLLPKPELHLGRAVVFLLFGSDAATSLTSGGWRPSVDVLRFVDPLIGTANGGHVFPGASLPYGMFFFPWFFSLFFFFFSLSFPSNIYKKCGQNSMG